MYTIMELANYLKVSRMTICRLMKRGEINYRKIGGQVRFMKSDIAAYLGCSVDEVDIDTYLRKGQDKEVPFEYTYSRLSLENSPNR